MTQDLDHELAMDTQDTERPQLDTNDAEPNSADEQPAPEIENGSADPETGGDSEAAPTGWTYAAYRNEKEKRQRLEQELQALKTQSPPDGVWDPDPVSRLETRALQTFGEDRIRAADQWFSQLNPVLQQRLALSYGRSADPFAEFLKDFDRVSPARSDGHNTHPKASSAPRWNIPPSLAQRRSAGPRDRSDWSGPAGLSDILGGQ